MSEFVRIKIDSNREAPNQTWLRALYRQKPEERHTEKVQKKRKESIWLAIAKSPLAVWDLVILSVSIS